MSTDYTNIYQQCAYPNGKQYPTHLPNWENRGEIRNNLDGGFDVFFEQSSTIVGFYQELGRWQSIVIMGSSPFHGLYHNQKISLKQIIDKLTPMI